MHRQEESLAGDVALHADGVAAPIEQSAGHEAHGLVAARLMDVVLKIVIGGEERQLAFATAEPVFS